MCTKKDSVYKWGYMKRHSERAAGQGVNPLGDGRVRREARNGEGGAGRRIIPLAGPAFIVVAVEFCDGRA